MTTFWHVSDDRFADMLDELAADWFNYFIVLAVSYYGKDDLAGIREMLHKETKFNGANELAIFTYLIFTKDQYLKLNEAALEILDDLIDKEGENVKVKELLNLTDLNQLGLSKLSDDIYMKISEKYTYLKHHAKEEK